MDELLQLVVPFIKATLKLPLTLELFLLNGFIIFSKPIAKIKLIKIFKFHHYILIEHNDIIRVSLEKKTLITLKPKRQFKVNKR